MNDRYLCRAKRTDNGEWVEGLLVTRKYSETGEVFEAHIIVDAYEQLGVMNFGNTAVLISPMDEDCCFRVDKNTICQCTGRKGEWEHDIFQYDDGRYEIQFCEYSLTWEAVSIFSSESIELGEFLPSEYIRLGNAIDNPELLEVE